MNVTRREFLAATLALPMLRYAGAWSVRVAFTGTPDSDTARGAQLAATEAERAAILLGIDFSFSAQPTNASATVTDDAIVVDGTTFQIRPAESSCFAWHPSLERFGAGQLNDRYRAEFKKDMTEDAWIGWIGVKIVWESALRARSGDAIAIRAFLSSPRASFDGHKGEPLRFENGTLRQPLYTMDAATKQVKACDADS